MDDREHMTGTLINGKALAENILSELKVKIAHHTNLGKRSPKLCTILVGSDPASQIYVRNKRKSAQEIGIESLHIDLPESVSEQELLSLIEKCNLDDTIDGILVQLPLPNHIKEKNVIFALNPLKDVDGFHPDNLGRLFLGMPRFIPCTPKGSLYLLQHLGIALKGKHAVVVGRSLTVGRPMSSLLLYHDATVTTCHRYTENLEHYTKQADVLVVATGNAHMIGKDHVKPGAIVIDIGISRINGKIVGDVDTQAVLPVVKAITPVPGGVGPMTIAMLHENTYLAYKNHISEKK